MISINGRWKGTYYLGPEFGPNEGRSFGFILELKEEDGNIDGVCIEKETAGLFREPVTITGFREDGLISFVKKYPHRFYVDGDGNRLTDPEKDHPEIEYVGEMNPETGKFEGSFQMVADTEQIGFGWYDTVLTGTWVLERADE
jgi:hypothetical protein